MKIRIKWGENLCLMKLYKMQILYKKGQRFKAAAAAPGGNAGGFAASARYCTGKRKTS